MLICKMNALNSESNHQTHKLELDCVICSILSRCISSWINEYDFQSKKHTCSIVIRGGKYRYKGKKSDTSSTMIQYSEPISEHTYRIYK